MHQTQMLRAKRTKKKTCANCKARYVPREGAQPFEKWCSLDCGVALSRANQEAVRAKKHRAARVALKPRSKWLQEAQQAVNAYVRERDSRMPCISCQRHHNGQYHAGHYRSVGAMPSLRFNTWNIHKQCSACNNHLSGALIDYRVNLIHKIGQARVDWLEGPQETKSMDIGYLRRIKSVFAKRTRHITRLRGIT